MRKIFYVVILVQLVNCSGFAINENIIGNYYLVAADEGNGCILSYHDESADGDNYGGIIEATVFAVGWLE